MVNEIFDTVRGRTLETAYFLNEGLFEEQAGVTTKGSDSVMVNKAEDAGKMIVRGDMVEQDTIADKTVKKCTTNAYMGFVVADPVGVPPTEEGMPMREATVGHMIQGSVYHLKLKDNNAEVKPKDYIVYDGSGFDKSATKVTGVVLVAQEGATANSGKYIDAFCKDIDFVASV